MCECWWGFGGEWGAGGQSKIVVTLAPALHNPGGSVSFYLRRRVTFDTFDTFDTTAHHPAALYVAVMRPVGQCLDS